MNMQQIMAQAQKMQKDILSKQKQIESMDFQGESDWVKVVCGGNKKLKSVEIISNEAFDSENSDILSDMIVLAVNDALDKIEKTTEQKLGSYAKMGGLF